MKKLIRSRYLQLLYQTLRIFLRSLLQQRAIQISPLEKLCFYLKSWEKNFFCLLHNFSKTFLKNLKHSGKHISWTNFQFLRFASIGRTIKQDETHNQRKNTTRNDKIKMHRFETNLACYKALIKFQRPKTLTMVNLFLGDVFPPESDPFDEKVARNRALISINAVREAKLRRLHIFSNTVAGQNSWDKEEESSCLKALWSWKLLRWSLIWERRGVNKPARGLRRQKCQPQVKIEAAEIFFLQA